jgi:hypothetical protein
MAHDDLYLHTSDIGNTDRYFVYSNKSAHNFYTLTLKENFFAPLSDSGSHGS